MLISVVMLSSCNPCQRLAKKCPPKIEYIRYDSIVNRDSIVYRDRIIRDTIPPDTVSTEVLIEVPANCPSINIRRIHVDGKYAEADAWVQNSMLKLELRQKEQVIEKILKDAEKETTHWRELYTKELTKETTQVKYIPKLYKIAFWYMLLSIIGISVFVGLKLRR